MQGIPNLSATRTINSKPKSLKRSATSTADTALLAALDKLEKKDRLPGLRIFSIGFLRDFHNRTEALRAEVNRDLVRLIAGHEDADTLRFTKRQ